MHFIETAARHTKPIIQAIMTRFLTWSLRVDSKMSSVSVSMPSLEVPWSPSESRGPTGSSIESGVSIDWTMLMHLCVNSSHDSDRHSLLESQ